MNADETGSENFIGVTYSGADPLSFVDLNSDRDGDLTFTSADLDAVVSVDGTFTATSSSNTIKDLVQGVTLNLAAAGTSTVSVTEDSQAVEDAIQSFVGAYNETLTTIERCARVRSRTTRTA